MKEEISSCIRKEDDFEQAIPFIIVRAHNFNSFI